VTVVGGLVLWYFFDIGKNYVINNYYQGQSVATVANEDIHKGGVLPFSIFVLAKSYRDQGHTDAENEELFKKYEGLYSEGVGYVKDVSKLGTINTVALNITEKSSDIFLDGLICYFKLDSSKSASSLKKGQITKFSGEVGSYGAILKVNNCQLI